MSIHGCCARRPRRRRRLRPPAAPREGKVNVEYVSANPTGPMHVGHARGAVFGDALASLLDFAGREVTREYYINDAGAQVDVLARSAYLRYREALGETDRRRSPRALSRRLSQAGRRGARGRIRRLRCCDKPEAEWLAPVRARAIAAMMAMIRDDLAALNIDHEVFSSERALTGADGGATACARRSSSCARRARLRGPPAAAQGPAGGGLGGPRADAVPLDPIRRRRRPAADQVRRRLHLFRQRHRLSQDQDRPRLPSLVDVWGADHGGYVKRMQAAVAALSERQGEARRPALPARAADARRRAGENVEALRRLRHLARSRRRGRRRCRPLHHADAQERRDARFRPRQGDRAEQGQSGLLRAVRACARIQRPAPGAATFPDLDLAPRRWRRRISSC